MNKSFKYRLVPSLCQEKTINHWFGCGRWVWNWCLMQNMHAYSSSGTFIFRNELSSQLPNLKDEYEWLSDAVARALQNRVDDFEKSLKHHIKNKNGFPKFKSKRIESHNTIRIDNVNGSVKPHKNNITIPKIGNIKYIKHRPLEGKLKSITIKKENNKWFVVCLCQLPDPELKQFNTDQAIGLDVGIKSFVALSDGTSVPPQDYKRKEHLLKRKQRQLAKKQKGSNNRTKARKKVNKQYCKIKNQRLDFIHKTSTAITKQYLFPMTEDLNIKGMVKNRKLAKAISDQGWSLFINQLHYKSLRNGGHLTKIDRWLPSSKTCSQCGCIKDQLLLSERLYNCSDCGVVLDRDTNAAINIKRWGIDLNTAGTAGIYASGKSSNGGDNSCSTPSYDLLKQEKSQKNVLGVFD